MMYDILSYIHLEVRYTNWLIITEPLNHPVNWLSSRNGIAYSDKLRLQCPLTLFPSKLFESALSQSFHHLSNCEISITNPIQRFESLRAAKGSCFIDHDTTRKTSHKFSTQNKVNTMHQVRKEILVLWNIGTAVCPNLVCWKGKVSDIEQQRNSGGIVSAVWNYVERGSVTACHLRMRLLKGMEIPNTFAITSLSL